jgi:RecA/RadA recombinase
MSSTTEQIENFLSEKDNAKFHFNYHEELNYKIPSGSLNLDLALDGGLPAGVHRFTGINEGGKTSCALMFAKNFQDQFKDDGMVVFIRSEGRLGPETLRRSGIDTSKEKFFVFDCNVFEKVFELIRMLVNDNKDNKKFFFIVDSVDALCRQNDYDKAFVDSEQVAGGALITSVFLKKMVLPIMKSNHIMILTSQVRVEVSANPYASRGGPKVKQAGGNAVKHYANYIIEFEERFTSDIMWENPSASRIDDKGNPIGHFCKIRFRKSINEKTGATVRYPIRYGMKDGKSVWIEREIIDMMRLWGFLEQKGSWINFDEDLVAEAKSKKIEFPDKIQGEQKLVNLIEEDEKTKDFLLNYIRKEFDKLQ